MICLRLLKAHTTRYGSDHLRQYQSYMHYSVTHLRRQAFYALPEDHQAILIAPPFSFLDTLIAVDDAIDTNAEFADSILMHGLSSFGLRAELPELGRPSSSPDGSSDEDDRPPKHPLDWRGASKANDMDKAQTIIKQMYRDWSAEGAFEREASNGLVLRDLDHYFPADGAGVDRNDTKVLVPGAGLGRLMLDICLAGFNVEGNDLTHHSLLASSYILNGLRAGQQHDLYPWATNFANRISRRDQLQCVKIPDIHPGTALNVASEDQRIHAFQRMNVSAADFIVLYSDAEHREQYDVVCTVFFIDTAPNILRYIETIRHCLKPGGLWINVGPLLWHYRPSNSNWMNHPRTRPDHVNGDDGNKGDAQGDTQANWQFLGIAEPGSVELTNEEVLAMVERLGFKLESQEITDENDDGDEEDKDDDEFSSPLSSPADLSSRSASAVSNSPSSAPRPSPTNAIEQPAHVPAQGTSGQTASQNQPPSQPRPAREARGQDQRHHAPSSDVKPIKQKRRLAGYIKDPNCMYDQRFRLAHWVARKTTDGDKSQSSA